MSIENNKATVKKYLEECWGKPDLELVDQLLAPNASLRMDPFITEEFQGTENFKSLIVAVRNVFPDLSIKVDEILAEGDRVAVRWTSTGTQKGSWYGAVPTGKKVKWSGNEIFRLSNGIIDEEIGNEDGLYLLYQLEALHTFKSSSN